jgi:predicted short-subunit dehydrogenase-like oxidoreductase (DUF2520 family)
MEIAVLGAGRVGTSLAVLWSRAGHRIVAVAGGSSTRERAETHLPGVAVLDPVEASKGAEVVVVATPDSTIADVCQRIVAAGSIDSGTAVAHVSGATGLDALDAAASIGATTFSIHPLQTIPSVEAGLDCLPGAGFAITATSEQGRALAYRLAEDAGGKPFRVADDLKALYHSAGVFASNYLVTITAIAQRIEAEAGVRDAGEYLATLQDATLQNIRHWGAAEALTGPAVRGDAATVERNLEALAERVPEAVPSYVALAELTANIAARSGRLPAEGHRAVEEILAKWR